MGKYSRYQDIDDEEYEEEYDDEDVSIIPLLSTISKWFIRIGIVVAVILLLFFIVKTDFMSAFLFVIGMIVAYFFGYLFMFCLDKFVTMNDE
jgi:hypothetical protein